MYFAKFKSVTIALFLAAGVVATGAAVGAFQLPAQPNSAREEQPDPPAPASSENVPGHKRLDPAPTTGAGNQHQGVVGPIEAFVKSPRAANPDASKAGKRRSNAGQPPSPKAPPANAMIGGGGFHEHEMGAKAQARVKVRMEAGIRQEIAVLSKQFPDSTPMGEKILTKLDTPLSMSFARETPLEDVLKYIKSATQGPNDSGIPIYVDPEGLALAEKTMQSPVTIDLEGVPLKTTLRLLLRQVGLAYCVKDGVLMISSPEIIAEELKELQVFEERQKNP